MNAVPPNRLENLDIARRALREVLPGDVVALDSGLPELAPATAPAELGAWFLRPNGTFGNGTEDGLPLSAADAGAVIRGGHVDLAILSVGQVDLAGNAAGRLAAAHAGVAPPGNTVDLAANAGRVIGVLPTIGADGASNIVSALALPADVAGRLDTLISDVGVFRVVRQAHHERTSGRLTLTEVAPGWSAGDIEAVTGVHIPVAATLREMEFAPPSGRPPSKVYTDGPTAIADLPDGATVFIDGFGGPGGMAHYLLVSLRDRGSRELTIVSNTAGIARVVSFGTPPGRTAIDHSVLVENGQVAKAIASFPVSPSVSRPSEFELAYRRGEVDLELVPQGTLAERLRAGGAGIHAFYTPTGAGTLIAEGKESRIIDGREYILEYGLRADFALIRAHRADTVGNLVYRGTSRNFNAVMAPAARVTVVEVDEIVEPGQLDPEAVVTPGVFVQRIVRRPDGFTGYE